MFDLIPVYEQEELYCKKWKKKKTKKTLCINGKNNFVQI